MSHINLSGSRFRDARIGPGNIMSSEQWVPATGAVVDPNSPPFLFVNPAGAINMLMPTSSLVRRGLWFVFVNLSANIVTLQTDGGAGFTTAVTVPATGATRVVCTGDTTQALGWRAW